MDHVPGRFHFFKCGIHKTKSIINQPWKPAEMAKKCPTGQGKSGENGYMCGRVCCRSNRGTEAYQGK